MVLRSVTLFGGAMKIEARALENVREDINLTIEKGFPLDLECERCGRRVPFLHLILVRNKGNWKTDSLAVCDLCHAKHEDPTL